jgi:hypothetical protein
MAILPAQLATDPLGRRFLAACREALAGADYQEAFTDRVTVTIPAASPAVGDLTIYSDGDELTAIIGDHTHCHFPLYMHEDKSRELACDAVVREALTFVLDLLADRIVVWSKWVDGKPTSGGTFYRDRSPDWMTAGATSYL